MGLVFQFPERHFLGDDLVSELTFAWPRTLEAWAERAALAARLEKVGGQRRRVYACKVAASAIHHVSHWWLTLFL